MLKRLLIKINKSRWYVCIVAVTLEDARENELQKIDELLASAEQDFKKALKICDRILDV